MRARFRQGGAVYVAQGELAVGRRPDDVIATTLGSCVAVCLWDPAAAVGGMNHVLLPDGPQDWSVLANIGGSSMDRLVNALLKEGASRTTLRAKVFGGAAMIAGFSNIGERNGSFALDYLGRECIPCDAQNLGGSSARQLKFWPASGRARLRLVPEIGNPALAAAGPVATNGVELF